MVRLPGGARGFPAVTSVLTGKALGAPGGQEPTCRRRKLRPRRERVPRGFWDLEASLFLLYQTHGNQGS